jgi:hypothetical protein
MPIVAFCQIAELLKKGGLAFLRLFPALTLDLDQQGFHFRRGQRIAPTTIPEQECKIQHNKDNEKYDRRV